ncbi:GntR family transcriptional regulator [Paracoccus sp. M683]|uniref:GntR family transcriptional regulator n=1 Tax=Paracoccus sp. M683 TaxID=2594268 RepID=UPI00117F6040|nr:GntR family transcriptional regulator [Paracoccus sp. M683]TRW99397.1 GntR family transcriptional regulator [Paracoccus sp. M683]
MKEKNKISASEKESAQRPLQGDTAYERLCDEIRLGKLPPGARLTETEIATRLAISRTPVREAIRRLEADGLVDHQPRTGAVVRKLDYPEIMELYEMRTVLEGTAARLAARAASPVELQELQAINDEMAAAMDDPAALVRLNRQFHLRLQDAARNRFLLKSMASVETTLMILGPSSMETPDRARQALAEHDALLQALTARDGAAAEAVMRNHIENAQLARLRLLRRADKETDDDN